MSQRSPYNDRYKVESKGKTRKSASAAKPKRGVADLTPRSDAKKSAAKKRGSKGRGTASKSAATFETTPEMKKLRRWWWVLWGLSLVVAVAILLMQQNKLTQFVPFAWGAWFVAMGGAFYLEFVPLRRARLAAMEAAKTKGRKGIKSKDSALKTQPTQSDEAERSVGPLAGLAGLFKRRSPVEGVVEAPPATTDDETGEAADEGSDTDSEK
jgi:hypothetical protein